MSAFFQLVAISGKSKGTSWPIHGSDIVLGRDANSSIVLADPIASRRHCRIFSRGNEVRLEDLGSRNPALVNGAPVREARLVPGDEVAIGTLRFVLSVTSSHDDALNRGDDLSDTMSWGTSQALELDVDSAKPTKLGKPRTIEDLSLLYEVSQEFGGCTSLTTFFTTVSQRLVKRFKPKNLWIAQVYGGNELFFREEGETGLGAKISPPLKEIRRALESRRGLLMPLKKAGTDRKELSFTLVAPMVVGGVNFGVIALETSLPDGAFDEEDLLFLVLLSQSLAPVLCAIQNVERLRKDNDRLRIRAGESLALVGASHAIEQVREQIAKAAQSSLPVLIAGETGTGKELAARILHTQSHRSEGPFVAVNCAAIPRELFESELFGHEKGAFTGATHRSLGLLAEANGGTLFLDEIGDLSLENQARILRAIEDGTFRRVGAQKETKVDIRVVAATNKDLREAIRTGTFRQDLYHRLRGFEVRIPPLHERKSDIPILAKHFFELSRQEGRRPLRDIAPDALKYLSVRDWPGNIRELRNCIQHAIAVAEDDEIQVADVVDSSTVAMACNPDETLLSLQEAEKRHLKSVLDQCQGNVREAAKVLGIGTSTLYKKLGKYGLLRS